MYPKETIDQIVSEITSSTPPIVAFGIGLPGSGKSTLLQSIGYELDTSPIDVDSLRNRTLATGWSVGAIDRLEHQISAEVSTHIVRGGVALIDSTNCHPEFRARDIALYRSLGARTIGAIWLDTPHTVALSRNGSRTGIRRVSPQTIDSMHAALSNQQPSVSEGFDWVVRISD